MDDAIALTVMIFFYAVVVLPLAVHKRMKIFGTDMTIFFVLVNVEACNAAVCALSDYLLQPGHPFYREDINCGLKYSILSMINATQLIRLAVSFPCVFLKNKELLKKEVFLPLIISSVVATAFFVSFLSLDWYLNMKECIQCRANMTLFLPIWVVLLLTPLLYTALSIVLIVNDSLEDALSLKSIVISIVLGCVTMTAAWSFTINALYVLDPFTRDPQTSSPDVISSLLFALALTIPTVSLVLKKVQ